MEALTCLLVCDRCGLARTGRGDEVCPYCGQLMSEVPLPGPELWHIDWDKAKRAQRFQPYLEHPLGWENSVFSRLPG